MHCDQNLIKKPQSQYHLDKIEITIILETSGSFKRSVDQWQSLQNFILIHRNQNLLFMKEKNSGRREPEASSPYVFSRKSTAGVLLEISPLMVKSNYLWNRKPLLSERCTEKQ